MTRRRPLDAWRCHAGHVYLHPHAACPVCGRSLRATRVPPVATLLLITTVRVSPAGSPFDLGLAVTVAGRARTLCRVEGRVRGTGRDSVLLERHGATIVARPARGRRA